MIIVMGNLWFVSAIEVPEDLCVPEICVHALILVFFSFCKNYQIPIYIISLQGFDCKESESIQSYLALISLYR